jgi:hypothetical protein
MQNMHVPSAGVKSAQDSTAERDFMLSSLRAAATRSRLITNLLETIAVALRQKRIDCAGASEWLRKEGLIDHIQLGGGR